MTRRKWNRLRRQRPELFPQRLKHRGAWETLSSEELIMVKKLSKVEAVGHLTALVLGMR